MKRGERQEMSLDQGDPVEKARITMVVEYSCILSGTLEEMEKAKAFFEGLAGKFRKSCLEEGLGHHNALGAVRPMTREEALAYVPRKFHMRMHGQDRHLCDTAFVSPRQITDDASKVTCKLCLRLMNA